MNIQKMPPVTALRVKAALLLLALFASAPAARACAICYGEPDSPMSQGLTWAIVALGAIVVTVLAGVVGFFVHANRHATEPDQPASQAPLPPQP